MSQAIHEHRLLPGTKLGEDELSDIYSVSRSVVRSALQALSSVEVVELRRNRGAFVAKLTIREALEQNEPGKALRLSGQFHIEISHFADQTTIAGFIERLVARSSLITALYWRRQSALCEKHAHHALVEAFRRRDGDAAEGLMTGHLVDIVVALDLRDTPKQDES